MPPKPSLPTKVISQPQATAPQSSTSTLGQSSNAPSAQAQTGVAPLPEPKRRGRPPGVPNKPKEAVSDVGQQLASKKLAKRPLPEDASELDKLTAPYRILVRPLLMGMSSGLEVADLKPLDAEEKESGMQAWACLLYQYGANIDAGLLVLMWTAGVMAPRLAEIALKKKEAKEKKQLLTPKTA